MTDTPDPRNSDNPAWSPDCTRVLFDTSRSGAQVEIWAMEADGSGARRLITGAGQTSWQPVTLDDGGGGGGGPFGCAPSETTLCLNRSRFEVRVVWEDFAGNVGSGRVVPLSSDYSGLFWFFHEDNWEMLVKVLDGCPVNGRYWVFAAAATNVAYTLKVTDSRTGARAEYHNAPGRSSPAIIDTAAFANCP